MKKIKLFTLAVLGAATVGFASCSQEDTEAASNNQNIRKNAIAFNVLGTQQKGTRGTAITTDNYLSQISTFSVWSYTGDSPYENYFGIFDDKTDKNVGVDINGDGKGNWSFANPEEQAYWPTGNEHLGFYAITNSKHRLYNTNFYQNVINEYSIPGMVYIVPREVENQEDVMYAATSDLTATSNAGTVPLLFKHALAQIAFKAKTSNSKFNVEIQSITLHNIYSRMFISPLGIDAVNGIYTLDVNNYSVGLASPVTFGYASGTVDANDVDGAMLLAPQIACGINGTKSNANMGTPWATTESAPVTIETADANKQQYIEVKCKIKFGNVYLVGSESSYGTTYIPITTNWQSGKRYVYTLDFAGGGYKDDGTPMLKPIKYTVKVTDWTDSSSILSM